MVYFLYVYVFIEEIEMAEKNLKNFLVYLTKYGQKGIFNIDLIIIEKIGDSL